MEITRKHIDSILKEEVREALARHVKETASFTSQDLVIVASDVLLRGLIDFYPDLERCNVVKRASHAVRNFVDVENRHRRIWTEGKTIEYPLRWQKR